MIPPPKESSPYNELLLKEQFSDKNSPESEIKIAPPASCPVFPEKFEFFTKPLFTFSAKIQPPLSYDLWFLNEELLIANFSN